MLTEALKEDIQRAYSRLLEEKGYRARRCQKTMIAEIARTLGNVPEDNSVCVVEAGTGTGKTIAYAIASIPIAKQLKKKIVIATATVALQEQIVYQDLPDIRLHSGLEFSFALAKGRRRYLCLSRLDLALQDTSQGNQAFSFFENADGDSDQVDSAIFDSMLTALGKGEWDGERDSWPEEVNHATWARVSTDHAQCTHRQCSHYENCYFYRARENIHRVDCIVTNQDLVLSDLMMGGGAVLPDP
ncbi:MAG: DEAD/DEAH box helicase, partial [Gammaproteobacteria bacterium]|nr:DEAD/DEAH box helicase [Gammaproteobacteria bacterium]